MKWFLLFAMASSPAYAVMYKCQTGGKTVYQDMPCPNAKVINNANGKEPTLEDKLNAMYRAESDRAMATREIREADIKLQKSGRSVRNSDHAPPQQEPNQVDKGNRYFSTNGGVIERPPGSDFSHDNQGNTYFNPPGSSFSYGPNGTTCFHFGDFANCK